MSSVILRLSKVYKKRSYIPTKKLFWVFLLHAGRCIKWSPVTKRFFFVVSNLSDCGCQDLCKFRRIHLSNMCVPNVARGGQTHMKWSTASYSSWKACYRSHIVERNQNSELSFRQIHEISGCFQLDFCWFLHRKMYQKLKYLILNVLWIWGNTS
jgi:hypothetical protein